MRERQFSYAIKVFEAQWDKLHDESVKPFFEQLKRDTHQIDARRRGTRQKRLGHDALLSYSVFQNAEGLRAELDRQDRGVGPRAKIGYFACHGLPRRDYAKFFNSTLTGPPARIRSPRPGQRGR